MSRFVAPLQGANRASRPRPQGDAASPLTLGCGVKPLRGKGLTLDKVRHRLGTLELLNFRFVSTFVLRISCFGYTLGMSSRLAFRLLLISGLVILGLVMFRQRQLAEWQTRPPLRAAPQGLAPRFSLADHHRRFVKLERYFGRERVVLAFFDAALGREPRSPSAAAARCFEALRQAGIQVVAVSDATPYANLQAEEQLGGQFPFRSSRTSTPTFRSAIRRIDSGAAMMKPATRLCPACS